MCHELQVEKCLSSSINSIFIKVNLEFITEVSKNQTKIEIWNQVIVNLTKLL